MTFVLGELVHMTVTGTIGPTTNYGPLVAVTGRRTFAQEGIANGNTTLWIAFNTTTGDYEINQGVYLSAGPAMQRGSPTVRLKSSTGAAINWGAATINIISGPPAVILTPLLNPELSGYLKKVGGVFSYAAVTTNGEQLITAADFSAMRNLLSLKIAPDASPQVQSYNATLIELQGLAKTDNYVIKGTGTAWETGQVLSPEIPHTPVAPAIATTVKAALDELAPMLTSLAISSTFSVSSDQTWFSTTETVLTSLNNLVVPGTPNGLKRYRVVGQITFDSISGDEGQPVEIRLRMGINGDATDTLMGMTSAIQGPSAAPSTGVITAAIPPKIIFPGSTDRITITAQTPGWNTGGFTIKAIDSWLYIEQVRA